MEEENKVCGNPDRQDKLFFERVWWFLLALNTTAKFPLTSLWTKIYFFVSFSASSLSSFICMSSTLSHPYSHFIEYFVSQTACLHLQSYCTGPTVKTFSPFQKYNKNHCQLMLNHKLCKHVMVWLEIILVHSLNKLMQFCTILSSAPLRPHRIYLSHVISPAKQLKLKKICPFLSPIYQCCYYIYLLTCGTMLAGRAAQFWWQNL